MAETPPWWLAHIFDNRVRALVQRPDHLLAPHVGLGSVVLEPGCGMGLFTIAAARRVGSSGRVHAFERHEQSIAVARERVDRLGLAGRVEFHEADVGEADFPGEADFALCMWMAHEVAGLRGMADGLHRALRPGGRLLLAEPFWHVSGRRFRLIVDIFATAGFFRVGRPSVPMSRAVLFERQNA